MTTALCIAKQLEHHESCNNICFKRSEGARHLPVQTCVGCKATNKGCPEASKTQRLTDTIYSVSSWTVSWRVVCGSGTEPTAWLCITLATCKPHMGTLLRHIISTRASAIPDKASNVMGVPIMLMLKQKAVKTLQNEPWAMKSQWAMAAFIHSMQWHQGGLDANISGHSDSWQRQHDHNSCKILSAAEPLMQLL